MTIFAIIPFVIAVLVFGAAGFAVYLVALGATERSMSKASLRSLEASVSPEKASSQLSGAFGDRVGSPAMKWMIGMGRRATPIGYMETLRHKLLIAGKPTAQDFDRFLAIRALGLALIPFWFVLMFFIIPLYEGVTRLAVVGLLCAFSVLWPSVRLNKVMKARQRDVRRTLPDTLDLLTISVEAGLGFEQALDRVVSAVPGPLSDEFIRMLGEMRAGSGRADAFRGVDERTGVAEVRSFVLAIIQADTFGVSIGRILRAQSSEMRVKRRQLAQEAAQKLPVKMLLPMVFCIFPCIMTVILAPALITIKDKI